MKLFWIEHTSSSITLMCLQDTPFNAEKPRRMAYVSPSFTFGDGSISLDRNKYRARVVATGEVAMFPTLDQAKDWAQAVVLLNQ